MKITLEFDTDKDNYDPHELWLIQNANNLWLSLCDIRSELREKWKYSEEQKLDKDDLWERFHEIINNYHLNGDDVI